jgi:hypothetical protein
MPQAAFLLVGRNRSRALRGTLDWLSGYAERTIDRARGAR